MKGENKIYSSIECIGMYIGILLGIMYCYVDGLPPKDLSPKESFSGFPFGVFIAFLGVAGVVERLCKSKARLEKQLGDLQNRMNAFEKSNGNLETDEAAHRNTLEKQNAPAGNA